MSSINNVNLIDTLAHMQDGTSVLNAETWNNFITTLHNTFNSVINKVNDIDENGTTSPSSPSEPSVLYVNGEIAIKTQGSYVLQPGGTYELSGYADTMIQVGDANSATPSGKTTIILNGLKVNTNQKAGIAYMPSDKSLVVEIKENSSNVIICNKLGESLDNPTEYTKGACIWSENNMVVTGGGYLACINSAGHGIKAAELKIEGIPHIYCDTFHDCIHGNKLCTIENGEFYFENGNDGVGTRSQDTSNPKGCILINGGKYIVKSLKEDLFDIVVADVTNVFEELFRDPSNATNGWYVKQPVYIVKNTQTMVEVEATMEKIGQGESVNDTVFSDEEALAIYNGTKTFDSHPNIEVNLKEDGYFFKGGVYNPNIQIIGAGEPDNFDVIDSNETGVVTVNDTVVEPVNGVYDCGTTENAIIKVTGVVQGILYCHGKAQEIDLDKAVIKPIIDKTAFETATSQFNDLNIPYGTAILYAYMKSGEYKSNITIQTQKYTGSSYIFGTIYSCNNIKLTPKKHSNLYITAVEGNGIYGSTVTIYNGGGNTYIQNCKNNGVIATEFVVGCEIGSDYVAEKALTGNVYVLNNGQYDVYARLNSSKSKKGNVYITTEHEGLVVIYNIYNERMYPDNDFTTGYVYVGWYGNSNGYSNESTNRLYYKNISTTTNLTSGFKINQTLEDKYVVKFN